MFKRHAFQPNLASYRQHIVRACLVLGAVLLSGCQAVLFGGLNATAGRPADVTHHAVIFDTDHQLALDIYAPRQAAHAPVVVFLYGGSWKSGKRQWYRWVGEALAQRGVVVVVPDYRQWPQVRLNGFMHDAARAVAWTHSHAGEYGGDRDELFVMGHSAGAHIGALLASNGDWLAAEGMRPRNLAGFIGLAGPYDFLPLTNPDYIDMFGHTHAAQLHSQPVHYVDGDEPPMLLLQGLADATVEPRNATAMATALRAHDESVQVVMYPHVGHLGIAFALSRPFRGKAPVLDDTLRFIHAQVQQRSASPAAASR